MEQKEAIHLIKDMRRIDEFRGIGAIAVFPDYKTTIIIHPEAMGVDFKTKQEFLLNEFQSKGLESFEKKIDRTASQIIEEILDDTLDCWVDGVIDDCYGGMEIE